MSKRSLVSSLNPVAANAGGVFYASNLLTAGYSLAYVAEQLGAAGFVAGAIAAILSAAEQATSFAGPMVPGEYQFPGFSQLPVTPGGEGGTVTVAVTAYLPCMYVSKRSGRTTDVVRWVDSTTETSYPPDIASIITELCKMCTTPYEECDPDGIQLEIAYITRS